MNLNLIRAREYYLNEDLDFLLEPQVEDLVERFGVDKKTLDEVIKRDGWKEARKANYEKFHQILNQAQIEVFREQSLDVASVRTRLFQDTVAILNNDIRKVHAVLSERLETMANKEIIAYFKLLLDVSNKVQETIDKTVQQIKEDNNREEEFWTSLKTKADTKTIIDRYLNKPEEVQEDIVGELIEEDGEKEKIFGKFDQYITSDK